MNNNRQSNNRRRSRNNNNRPNNNNRNGFDNQNRIDNRARGNAAQMLEKYKKLASDAQQNDDRVNAEYYLQFADHYFRVLADTKARQEEKQDGQQGRRPPNRDFDREAAGEDQYDFEDRTEIGADVDDADPADDISTDYNDESYEREDQQPRERQPRESQPRENQARENQPRENQPRARGARGKQNPRGDRGQSRNQDRDQEQSGLDLSVLPPSISTSDSDFSGNDVSGGGEAQLEKPARKPRARRAKANDDTEIAAAAE